MALNEPLTMPSDLNLSSEKVNELLEHPIKDGERVTLTDEELKDLKEKARQRAVEQVSNEKHSSFSKKMIITTFAITIAAMIIAVWFKVTKDIDLTDILTIVVGAFGMDSIFAGFYFWKEKNANRARYAQQFVLVFADEYGVENAIRIAEIVLKD